MTIFTFIAISELQRRYLYPFVERYLSSRVPDSTLLHWKHYKTIPVVDPTARAIVAQVRRPGQLPSRGHRMVRGKGLSMARALLQTKTIEHLIDAFFYYWAHLERRAHLRVGLEPLNVRTRKLSIFGKLWKGGVKHVYAHCK